MALAGDISAAFAGLAASLPEVASPAVYHHRTPGGVEVRTIPLVCVPAAGDPLSDLSPQTEGTDATIYVSAADWRWTGKPLVGDVVKLPRVSYAVAAVATIAGIVYKLTAKEVAE